ncbi:MAG: M48 family metalloprotease [Pseudomonadota bacterium]
MRFRQHERTASQSTLRLLALFGLVLVGLLLAVNAVLGLIYWATFPFASGFPTLFFETNSALVLLFVLGGCWIETTRLREGGAHVARMAGGREAQLSSGGELGQLERRFANTVQEMVIASGHAGVPSAWVLPKDDAINAFAAGWGGGDAVVAVTRGALERLTRAELQGVVAHEFSHLVHGDTRLNMRLVGLVWGLQMIWGLGVALWEPDDRGRRGFGALFGLGLMAVGSLGWAAGRLLQAAVSRQREFLADASAVKYTRVVDGLGGALRKIADQQLQGRAGLQSAHAASLAHLLLSNRGAGAGWGALWHTHPPLTERLRRLYGRDVLPLPAPVLEVDAGAAEPLLRLAPGGLPTSASPPNPSAPALDDASPESHRHDALQNPASFDDKAREQDALGRIERWHGPGEWQAAMLALAMPLAHEFAPDDLAAQEFAWQRATANLQVAAAVRREVEALGPQARRQVFAILVQRACSASPMQRRALRVALRARWSALPPTPATQWRALALGLLLGRPRHHAAGGPVATSLMRHAGPAHAATSLLALSLGAPADSAQAWQNAVTQALAELGVEAPRSPSAGLAPPTPLRSLQLALRVRHISTMQRPLLMRAWLLALERSGLSGHADSGDALHMACLLLDLPVPESLLAP